MADISFDDLIPPANRKAISISFDDLIPSSEPGIVEDVAGGIQGGVIRGAAGLAGLPGFVTGLADKGADWLAKQTVGRIVDAARGGGWSADERPYKPRPLSPAALLPQPEDAVRVAENLIGETYRPKTLPGKYAGTVGEFVGSGARAAPALVGGLLSEGAGQLTAGSSLEPLARAAGV